MSREAMVAEKPRLERFLAEEGLSLDLDSVWVDPRQRLSALCYIQRDDAILLLKRNKEPFTGFWTAPGGKMQPGEDPRQAAVREAREETGLRLEAPRLRFIASELGPEDKYCWLLFGFVAYSWTGTLGRTSEGELAWIPREELGRVKIPEVDGALLPHALEPPRGQVYLAHVLFGEGGSLRDVTVTELPRRR